MKGSDTGIPYAAYIHPSNADAGAYGGMSFVIFPVEREAALIESALSTLLRRTDSASRGRAAELAPELASHIDEVRRQLVSQSLERVLS